MIFVILIIFHFPFNNLHILIGICYMYLFKFLVLAFSNWHFSVLLYHYYIIGTYIPLIGFILQSAKKGANRDCLSSLISQSEGCGQARNYSCAGVKCSRAPAFQGSLAKQQKFKMEKLDYRTIWQNL